MVAAEASPSLKQWGQLAPWETEPLATAEEHGRMEALLAQNGIPRSTLEMRLRSRLTFGSEYGVPSALKEALWFGYLHPNLGAPQGLQWKCRA